MTQTFNPFGLSLVEHKGGKPNYPVTRYPLAPSLNIGTSSNFGQGDVMCVSVTGASPGITEYIANNSTSVSTFVAAQQVAGVWDAVNYTNAQGTVITGPYWAANTPVFGGYRTTSGAGTDVMVTVNDLPYCVYQVQCNAPLQGNGEYFTSYNLTANGGVYTPTNPPSTGFLGANPATGQSTQAVNVAAGPGEDNQTFGSVRIIGLAPQSATGGPNNWTDPFPIVHVIFNGSVFNFPTLSAT